MNSLQTSIQHIDLSAMVSDRLLAVAFLGIKRRFGKIKRTKRNSLILFSDSEIDLSFDICRKTL